MPVSDSTKSSQSSPAAAPAVITTLIVDDERLARSLIRSLVERDPTLEVLGECGDGEAALTAIRHLRPDLVFLDVQMPLLDGVQVIRRLAAADHQPYVIFLTAFDDYAIDAFEYNALDYLVKPIRKARFRQSVERARAALRRREMCQLTERMLSLAGDGRVNGPTTPEKTPPAEDLLVWKGTQAVNIACRDIIWVEAANQYVRIHLAEQEYIVAESLGSFYKKLQRPQFQRIHRSAVINTLYLDQVSRRPNGTHELLMQGGVRLSLARSRRNLVPQLLRSSRRAGP